MVSYTISLSEKQSQQLREIADQYHIAPEELVRASIEDLLTRPQSEFQTALEYVLKKNAELYKRLA
ncbi:MAG: DNA-binding protein [Anaerolineales bacterium]